MISITYLLLLILLGLVLPFNGVLSGRRIKQFIIENPDGKMIFYRQTVVLQIVLTVLVLAAMVFNRDSIQEIGLSFVKQPFQVVSLLTVCFLGWWGLLVYRFDPQKLERDIEKEVMIKFLLPATKQEYRWSVATSFAAGISEEIVFRGFLFWQMNQLLPLVPAILLTNLIFGLIHFGTGLKNASLAFCLGVALSLILLYTESLWLLMVTHVLIDIYSMTKGKRYYDLNDLTTHPIT